MPERAIMMRAAATLAMAYSVPLAFWLSGQAILSSRAGLDLALYLQGMLNTLLLLQACSLVVGLPWLMRDPFTMDQAGAIAMLVVLPAPLYTIALMTGAAHWQDVALLIPGLLFLAAVLRVIYATCLAIAPAGELRGLVVVCVQLVLVAQCWHYRQLWQQVLINP